MPDSSFTAGDIVARKAVDPNDPSNWIMVDAVCDGEVYVKGAWQPWRCFRRISGRNVVTVAFRARSWILERERRAEKSGRKNLESPAKPRAKI